MDQDYLKFNREAWNAKVESHLNSDFYQMDAFRSGWNSLSEIELPLLSDIKGKSLLHLQCHFGQDTLSLARMGANCLGIDLSDEAIKVAQNLNKELGLDAEFQVSDVYSVPQTVNRQFDLVFSSYGTIGWLPDMDRWAKVVAQSLKPGGAFIFAEFHPVIWIFDGQFKTIEYSYFNQGKIEEVETGTYADREAKIENRTISWNHNLGEVISALRKNGLQLESFDEFDFSPYNCFNNMLEVGPRRYQIKGLEGKLPMVYRLKMVKPQ